MIDLHSHSTCSDGHKSVKEIASLIRQRPLQYFSLTDHDTVDGYPHIIEKLSGSGITVIPGIEITCLWKGQEIHVLTYDFDIEKMRTLMQERSELVWQQKVLEMEDAKEKVRAIGFSCTKDLAPSVKRPVGYTITKDIFTYPSNLALLEKQFGKVIDHGRFFYEFQAEGKPAATKRSGVDDTWLLKHVRPLAENMILAHPFVPVSVFVQPLSIPDIKTLSETLVDGIEIYHDHTSEDQIAALKDVVEENELYFTGGSDNHGRPADTVYGTYGQERIIPGFSLRNYGVA